MDYHRGANSPEIAPRFRFMDKFDMLTGGGFVLVVIGLGLLSIPAALIVGGGLLMLAGVYGARQ